MMVKDGVGMKRPIEVQAEEYWRWCREVGGFLETTMVHYEMDVRLFLQSELVERVEDVTNQHISQFMAMLSTGALTGNVNCGRSINTRVKHLCTFLHWCKEERGLDVQVRFRSLHKARVDPARRVFCTREELGKALRVATEKEALLILIAFDSGARVNELRLLHVEQIVRQGEQFVFDIVGKGSKQGFLRLTSTTWLRLFRYIEERGIDGYIFTSKRSYGGPYTVGALRLLMKGCFARAGIYDFCPHDIRRGFAVDTFQSSGRDIFLTSRLMRHSDVKTTQIYLSGLDDGLGVEYTRIKRPV